MLKSIIALTLGWNHDEKVPSEQRDCNRKSDALTRLAAVSIGMVATESGFTVTSASGSDKLALCVNMPAANVRHNALLILMEDSR